MQEPVPVKHPPALTAVEGGKPRSRRKPAEEIVTPNPAGWDEHKRQRRDANLNGEILRRHRQGEASVSTLAAEYGVAYMTVSRLVKGLAWKHLDASSSEE